MDAAQSAKTAASGSHLGKRRNDNAVIVANDDRFDLAGSMNKQSDTPVELCGNGSQRAGCFSPKDLLGSAFSLGKAIKISELFGFQPSGIAGDSRDGITLLNK